MQTQTPTMVCERECLLCCAAAPGDDASRAQFGRLAQRDLDWKYVLSAAEKHGIVPLLRSRVEEFCPDAVPAEVRAALARAYVANAAHNLVLTAELLRILDWLKAENIEAVPFKGPALAEQIFGSVAMRQFCDLDILVRPENVLQAKRALIAHGFEPEFTLTEEREAEYVRSEHAFQLRRPGGGVIIELHWSFGSRDQVFPLKAGDVWTRLTTQTLQGRTVNTLAEADLFIYLCMHGAKHTWERLEWICSLAEFARSRPRLDWDAISMRAKTAGALRGLHLAVLLINQICAVPLPPELAGRAIADSGARALAEQVVENLFASELVHRTREFQRHAFYLRTRERVSDRARIVWFSCARIPHPMARDWDLFRLPSNMSFLYYLLRPLRLFRDYGLRILQG